MEKLVRDGKVAILVSYGYGAGWYTWNTDFGIEIAMNKRIALAVLGESDETAIHAAEAEYPKAYHGGVTQIEVEWIDVGTQFRISEYDGSESLVTNSENYWNIA